ncbi:MAG: molecular chaperone TorD family protein [Armatimonadota bacterium]|nr:molecular chaperone TorD family protein [Armatimonadota bacterium]MDR7537232.1 molecular chaperone TorD family protein [Armatimonadota bacterium]
MIPVGAAGTGTLAVLRETLYRLLAVLLLYPTPARLRTATVLADALAVHDDALAALPCYLQWRRVRTAIETGPHTVLEDEFARLFLVPPRTPPCETAYSVAEPQWVLADLTGEYAAAGAALAAEVGEPPDAATVELEFMAYLCGREREAWGHHAADAAAVLAREHRFLQRHLVRWMPAFAHDVACAAPKSFYAQLADMAGAFVLCDRDLVDLARTCLRRTAAVPLRA